MIILTVARHHYQVFFKFILNKINVLKHIYSYCGIVFLVIILLFFLYLLWLRTQNLRCHFFPVSQFLMNKTYLLI